MTFRVLVTDPLAPAAFDYLKSQGVEAVARKLAAEELVKEIASFDALLVRSETKVTRAVLEAGRGRLKVVGRGGVGVDNIDVAAAKELGVAVVNAPAASTEAVAELALAHMLALARHLQHADASTRAGKWEKKAFMGIELKGRRLTLLGVGRIGGRVGELARAFGMAVTVYDPYVTKDAAAASGFSKAETVAEAVRDADFVSVHSPLTPETRNLVDARLLASMKRGSFVVNCARGGIVDEAALADALKSGHLAGAALDVFAEEPAKSNPLFEVPTAHFTPHLGASTGEAQDKAGLLVAEDVWNVLTGKRANARVA